MTNIEKLKAESRQIFSRMDSQGRESLTIQESNRLKEIDRQLATAGPGRMSGDDWVGSGSLTRAFHGVGQSDRTAGFDSPREFLQSVMDASLDPRSSLDSRLLSLTAGSDEASGASDPYGGFLLPVAFSPDVLSAMADADPTAALVTRIPLVSGKTQIPARTDKNHSTSVSGGLRVYRRAETDTSPASRMEMELVTLTGHSLFGLCYASEELLAKSAGAFLVLLEAGFKDEFSSALLNERLNGSGAGEFEGVLNAPCVVEVAKENGQAANTVVKANVDKMVSRAWRYSQCIWLANHNVRPQLKSLSQAVGTGGAPVPYLTSENGQEMLEGRPIHYTEFAKTLGTAGDLLLSNWSQYLEGSVTPGVQSAESIHVRFINHERTFKFWLENDGRCWWRSALTPRNGDTLSPFIKLASRA